MSAVPAASSSSQSSEWSTPTPDVARKNIRLVSFMCGNAATALIEKCKDPSYRYPTHPNVRCFLSAFNLIQEDGRVSDTVKKVVLDMIKEEAKKTRTPPLQKEVSKMTQ